LPEKPSAQEINQWRDLWRAAYPDGYNVEQESLRIVKELRSPATEHDFVFGVVVMRRLQSYQTLADDKAYQLFTSTWNDLRQTHRNLLLQNWPPAQLQAPAQPPAAQQAAPQPPPAAASPASEQEEQEENPAPRNTRRKRARTPAASNSE